MEIQVGSIRFLVTWTSYGYVIHKVDTTDGDVTFGLRRVYNNSVAWYIIQVLWGYPDIPTGARFELVSLAYILP